MICSSCGYKSIVFDFVKCPRCGFDYIKSHKITQSQNSDSVLDDHAEESSETSQEACVKFCTSCGKGVNIGDKYCGYCGKQMVQAVKEKIIVPMQPVQYPSAKPVALADSSASVSADLHDRLQKRGIKPENSPTKLNAVLDKSQSDHDIGREDVDSVKYAAGSSKYLTLRVIRAIAGFIAALQVLQLLPVLTWFTNLSATTGAMWALVFIKFVALILFGAIYLGLRMAINRLHTRKHAVPHPAMNNFWSL